MPPRTIDQPFSFTPEQRQQMSAALEGGATKDFYADLSDEEREEEGLPAREAEGEKPAAKPAAAAPGAEEGEKPEELEPEEPEEDDEEQDDDVSRQLLNEIVGLREGLADAVDEADRGRTAVEERDELLDAALDHDDPVVRGLAERLRGAETRLAQHENRARLVAVNEQRADDDRAFQAVQKNYTVDGEPMTQQHVEQIEDFMLENPEVARQLSIEQVTRAVFPTAQRAGLRSSPKPPPKKAAKAGGEAPTATIVDQGSGSGGAPVAGYTPKPHKSIEDAVKAAGQRFGWTR